jgi:hypothetical protein
MAEATVAAPGGQDTSPFGIRGKLNDKVGGRNWTWPLRIACIIIGIGFVIAGFFGLFTLSLNPLTIISSIVTAVYVILLGLVLIAAIIPYPARWHTASLKWFGLLHKYRGRGFYLIFVGILTLGCGIAGWVVGGCAIALGIFHFIIAIWFKDTLDKKAPLPHEMTPAEQEAQRKKDARGVVLEALF